MKMRALLIGALSLGFALNAQAGVVVAAANGKVGQLNVEQIKKVFLGRSDGSLTSAIIFQKGGATRADFDKKVLGKSTAEVSTYWSRLIFTGKAKAPIEVSSDAEVKAKLAVSPGAVGYISESAVDSSVKVLYKF